MNGQMGIFIDFENVALWAEREFFDFEVTTLMEYLQSRGPAVVKRAYGDWSRFTRYRDEMMNNSIDLIQIYSVRSGKNRADIRMAIDAFEIAMTRSQIQTFVIVSGDSDFSPLAAKLREYGRYTIGIGPRSSTHELLVKSCDEFVYLETALGEMVELEEQSCVEIEKARALLSKALQAHAQRGDVPLLATRLKQTMLLLDPAFNEANFGYAHFKSWLEDNRDLVKLILKDMQLFVAPGDYLFASNGNGHQEETGESVTIIYSDENEQAQPQRQGLDSQYRQVFTRMKISTVDFATRRDVLRDIYRELNDHPGEYTIEEIIDFLAERYAAKGLVRNTTTLREIVQLAMHQQAFDFREHPISLQSPVWLAPGIDREAVFVERAEADFIYAIIRSGYTIDLGELAYLLLNDRNQEDYIQHLLEDLRNREMITRKSQGYMLPGKGILPFENEPVLQILVRDIKTTQIPDNVQPGSESARAYSKKAMLQRSQDFAASSHTYLLACRLQWDAVENGEPGATMEDLSWYMASYASAIAGKLSQVNRDYASARPYYLAFFALVQEEDPLWGRMRGLINPMLAYFWSNAGRELDINVSAWNLSMASPAQIAVYAATHPNVELRKFWQMITMELARVNPGLLHRIANQLMLSRTENPEHGKVADQMEEILSEASMA
ncbi:MAG TPA: NYN domain-containing protein [Anaerolineales bacterium]|nr:NYN domain-containing protein [Anaerolineales bacterium]